MNITGIYKIKSKIKPERIYMGSAINIGKRWSSHLRQLKANIHGNIKLQRHFNKYGEADLQFSVLLGCEKEDLIKTEQYFLDSYNPWFNICQKAKSRLGVKASEETKQKMRKPHVSISPLKGRKNPALSERMLGNNYGRKGKGRKLSQEQIDRMRARKISEETRIKMSNSQKGKHFPYKTREKAKGRIAWNKGLTKETDKRIKKYAESMIGNQNGIGNKGNRKNSWNRVKSMSLESIAKEKATKAVNKLKKLQLILN